MIKTNKKYGNIIHESGKIELKTEWWFNDMTELLDFRDLLLLENRKLVVYTDSLYMFESTMVKFERHMFEDDEEE